MNWPNLISYCARQKFFPSWIDKIITTLDFCQYIPQCKTGKKKNLKRTLNLGKDFREIAQNILPSSKEILGLDNKA